DGLPSITDSTASLILFATSARPSSPGPGPPRPAALRVAGRDAGGSVSMNDSPCVPTATNPPQPSGRAVDPDAPPGTPRPGGTGPARTRCVALLRPPNRQYVVGTPSAMSMLNAKPLCSTVIG